MSCDGEDSVSVINTTSKRLKDGHLRRFKDKMFGSKWPDCYAVLYQDSTFVWYDKEGGGSAKGCVQLKLLAPYITVGAFTDKLPNRPSLPDGGRVQNIIAIGTDSRGTKIHWFLCNSEESLNEWMTHIVSALPPPPQPPQPFVGRPPMAPPVAQPYTTGNGPPPYTVSQQPIGPPPSYGPQQQPRVYAYQPQPQPSNTTVIVDRGYDNSYSSGPGLGTGLLVGGVAGYALGSMTHHHGYGGYGYGGGYGFFGDGYGYGYGGGGYSDNDTTIINNYNVTNINDNDNTYNTTDNDYSDSNYGVSDDYSQNYGNGGDDYGYGGGNDFGGDDYGGDDYGGGDY